MDKVYLVLRNNQQTGPFTIGELLQQQLRPSDMIWIEGKSTAWTYLSELELTPFLKTSLPETPGGITLKSGDEIEKKAEELRQRILSSAPKTFFPKHTTEIESYASPYKFADEEIEFVDHRKIRKAHKNTVLGELFLTCFVIGLFIVGIYKGKSILGVKNQVVVPATRLNSNDAHAAQKRPVIQQVTAAADTIRAADSSSLPVAFSKPKQGTSRKNQSSDSAMGKISEPITILSPSSEEEKKEEVRTEALIKLPEEIPVKKEISTPQVKKEARDKTSTEDKKGFLKGIFKKKKKEETSGNSEQR